MSKTKTHSKENGCFNCTHFDYEDTDAEKTADGYDVDDGEYTYDSDTDDKEGN